MALVCVFALAFSLNVFAGEKRDDFIISYGGNTYKYENKVVSLNINGEDVKTGDMPALIIDSRSLVPVREVFESPAFGAEVHWNGKKAQVYISYADNLIVLQLGNKTATVNGKEHVLDVPPMLIHDMSKENAKTMIPLRFVSESLGFKVDWDQKTYTALLSGEGYLAKADKTDENELSETSKKDGKTSLTDIANKINHEERKEGELVDTNEEKLSDEQVNTKHQREQLAASRESDTTIDSTNKDSNIVDEKKIGKKLNNLNDADKIRELPTGLRNDPINFDAKYDVPNEKNILDFRAKSLPDTIINFIKYYPETKTFVIDATSEVSDLKTTYWDDKFILDIENAVNDLDAKIPLRSYSEVVSGIRTSQFSESPMTTRIVFDLRNNKAVFRVGLNEARDKIIVKLATNFINNISLKQDDKGDYIDVQAVSSPDVNVFRLSEPDRIVLDMPETTSLIDFMESVADGQYVKKIRTAQFTDGVTRIVVEVDGQPDYKIEKLGDGLSRIRFSQPNYGDLAYENTDKPTVQILNDRDEINSDEVTYKNDYLDKKFIITLKGDYSDKFGEGLLKVRDGIIDEVSVDLVDGNTVITIKTAEIYEFRLEDVDGNLQIKAYKPRELFSKIVVVDPGHGGLEVGALGNGIVEKDLNFDMAMDLKKLTDANADIKVYYTRLDDRDVSLQKRCDISNEINPDFFLSIHNNSAIRTAHGTETWYFSTGSNVGFLPVNVAQLFQDRLIGRLGLKDRKIKEENEYYVLKHTNNVSILVEVGFISNPEEAEKLKDDYFIGEVAKALYDGILDTFDAYPTGR